MKLFKYRIYNLTNSFYLEANFYTIESVTKCLDILQTQFKNEKFEVHAYLIGTVALIIENE